MIKKASAMSLAVKRILKGLGFFIVLGFLLSGGIITGPADEITVTVTISSDSDDDGLPDDWERRYFGDLDYGCEDDPDEDRYTNCEEYQGGSDPTDENSIPFCVPAMVRIKPHVWNLSWLNEPDDFNGNRPEVRSGGEGYITAYISLENVEVETILPTSVVNMLEVAEEYGDFVVVEVVPAKDNMWHGFRRIRSVTLEYKGTNDVDILASSGNRTWDFYGVKQGDMITIDADEGEKLAQYSVLSYYTPESPLYSAADIIPETILLNNKVPIIEGSAELITRNPSLLDQSRVIAGRAFTIVSEDRHHVSITNLGETKRITLEVGNQTVFEDAPYPIRWDDRFSLEEDGEVQMIGIYASKKEDRLDIVYYNLQEEAKIYLDSALALTILPDERLQVLRVWFNRSDAISSLPKEVLDRGGDWEVTTYEGVWLMNKLLRKHIIITNLGNPENVKLVIGDSVIFDDEPFPIKWEDRCFMVDGERQDISIYTFGRFWHNKSLSIHCRRLTKDAKLYLDGMLVLVMPPPPDIEVNVRGEIEIDGDPETFDRSFLGTDEIKLRGKIQQSY